MLNSISHACILLAVHACSLYLYTTISVVSAQVAFYWKDHKQIFSMRRSGSDRSEKFRPTTTDRDRFNFFFPVSINPSNQGNDYWFINEGRWGWFNEAFPS